MYAFHVRRRRWARMVCVAAACALPWGTACRAPTQITLALSTDLGCMTWREGAVYTGFVSPSAAPDVRFDSCERGGSIGTVVVLPRDADDALVSVTAVLAIDRTVAECVANPADRGCITARRSLPFVPHDPLRVPIGFLANCRGVVCDAGATCYRSGLCGPARLDPARCSDERTCVLDGDGVSPPAEGGTDAASDAGAMPDGDAQADGDGGIIGPDPMGYDRAFITSGDSHVCATTAAGRLKCWGLNLDEQLSEGANHQASVSTPVNATVLDNALSVAATASSTCVLTATHDVMCWGRGANGELGDNTFGSRATPLSVPGLSNVLSLSRGGIAAGRFCAVLNGDVVKCWGSNNHGAIGDGSTGAFVARPATVVGLPAGARGVVTGDDHTCARFVDGSVWCWGGNGSAELGDATGADHGPRVVTNVSDVMALVAGAHHTCALTNAGAVRCWGANDRGQIGSGSASASSVPVSASLSGPAVAIGAGAAHACATLASGTSYCWGSNSAQQLGDGADAGMPVHRLPVPVSNLPAGIGGWALGRELTCARTQSAQVRCWGNGSDGQFGDGTTGQSSAVHVVLGFP